MLALISDSDEKIAQFLHVLLEDLIEFIPSAQTGSVLVRENNHLCYKAAVGYDLSQLQKVTFQLKRRYLASTERQPNIIKHVRTWDKENLPQEDMEILAKYGRIDSIKVLLSIPIYINGEIWGTINVENHEDEDALGRQDVIKASKFKTILQQIIKAKVRYEGITATLTTLEQNIRENRSMFQIYYNNKKNLDRMLFFIKSQTSTDTVIYNRFEHQISEINSLDEKFKHNWCQVELNGVDNIFNKKVQNIVPDIHATIDDVLPIVSSFKIHITKNDTTVFTHHFSAQEHSSRHELDTASFPVCKNYTAEITLCSSEPIRSSDYNFFSKKLILYILFKLQNQILTYVNRQLEQEYSQYNELLTFFRRKVNPFLENLEEHSLENPVLNQAWSASISNMKIIIDNSLLRAKNV